MQTLQKNPDKLTLGEFSRRLKENPNDPELQEYKKQLEEITESIIEYRKQFIRDFYPSIQYFRTQVLPDIVSMIEGTSAFANSLRETIESIRSLSEPIKALIEAVAQIKTPLLYMQLDVLHEHQIINVFSESPISLKSDSSVQEILTQEKKVLDNEIIKIEHTKPNLKKPYYYYADTNSMILMQTKVITLNFGFSGGEDNVSILAKVFIQSLDKRGQEKNGFLEIGLKISEIIQGLKEFGIVGVTNRWISNTKNNLLNKKIPAVAKGLIILSDYDKNLDGYYLRIRLNPNVPLLENS